ncbi:MAG: methyl-accepting chemotaxis protein [Eubacteriaceae bacterium]
MLQNNKNTFKDTCHDSLKKLQRIFNLKKKKNNILVNKKGIGEIKTSIKFQILIIFLVSIGIACLLISIITYRHSSNALLNKVQQNLSTIAYQSATNISYKIENEKKKTELLAGNYIINDNTIDNNEKLKFLKLQSDKNDSIALCVFDNGLEYISSNLQKYNISDKDFFIDALSGETQMSNVLVEKDNSFLKMNIYYSTPIYDKEENIKGVLVNIKDAKEISIYLKRINISEGSNCYIIDGDGNIIADKKIQRVIDEVNLYEENVEDEGINLLLNDLTKENVGYGYYTLEEIPTLVGYSSIEGTDYTLIVQSPATEVLGDIEDLKRITIAILLISLIIISTIILIILNKELNPIQIIAKNAQQISEGYLYKENKKLEMKNNEIGILSKAFNIMLNKLREIMENLKDTSENMDLICVELDKTSKLNMERNKDINEIMNSVIQVNEDQVEEINKGVELLNFLSSNLDKIQFNIAELSNQSNEIESYVDSSIGICNNLNDDSKDSISASNNMRISLNKTSVSAKNIESKLIEIIKITQQINLVSINAQIEAARIKNGNTGFDVVANEIKSLSEQTSEFTKEISKMVKYLNIDVMILMKNLDIIDTINIKNNKGTTINLNNFINIQKGILHVNNKLNQVKGSSVKISNEKDEIICNFNSIFNMTNKNKEKIDSMKSIMAESRKITYILDEKSIKITEESKKLNEYSNFFIIK